MPWFSFPLILYMAVVANGVIAARHRRQRGLCQAAALSSRLAVCGFDPRAMALWIIVSVVYSVGDSVHRSHILSWVLFGRVGTLRICGSPPQLAANLEAEYEVLVPSLPGIHMARAFPCNAAGSEKPSGRGLWRLQMRNGPTFTTTMRSSPSKMCWSPRDHVYARRSIE